MVVQRAGQRPMIAVLVIMQSRCTTFDAAWPLDYCRHVTIAWTILKVPVMLMAPAARLFLSWQCEKHVKILAAYVIYIWFCNFTQPRGYIARLNSTLKEGIQYRLGISSQILREVQFIREARAISVKPCMFVYKANKSTLLCWAFILRHLYTNHQLCNQQLTMHVSYSAVLIRLFRNSDKLHHVYSEAVVTTGIHAVCFL